VKANQACYPVRTMCRVLKVSTSGFYAWRGRPLSNRYLSDLALKVKIRAIHDRSRGTYGRPRVHAELKADGERISGKRVARLMREEGLAPVGGVLPSQPDDVRRLGQRRTWWLGTSEQRHRMSSG
jgi:hypothetical protein